MRTCEIYVTPQSADRHKDVCRDFYGKFQRAVDLRRSNGDIVAHSLEGDWRPRSDSALVELREEFRIDLNGFGQAAHHNA